jgi:hypothetical protein
MEVSSRGRSSTIIIRSDSAVVFKHVFADSNALTADDVLDLHARRWRCFGHSKLVRVFTTFSLPFFSFASVRE